MTSLEDIMAKPRVSGLVADLDLSDETQQVAEQFARDADEGTYLNRDPNVVAASAIYAAALLCNEKRTQAEVGEAAGVSCVSIRDCYSIMVERDDVPATTATRGQSDKPQQSPGLFEQAKAMLTGGDAA